MRNRNFHLRQLGLPKHIKKRLLILLIVFAVAFVFFTILLNHKKSYKTQEMSAATLPTISSSAYKTPVTQLHGYVQKMDATYMRDSVIPLNSKRRLPLKINTYGANVTGISYEIRSTDTSRKIAETRVENFKTDSNGIIPLSLQVENLVNEGEEYLFIITLTTDEDKEIYYYTRVLMPVDYHAKECLNFVKDFHEKTLNGKYAELSTYVETGEDVNTDTLSEVNLQSSIEQIGFVGFDGELVDDPVIEFKDINSDYCVVEMNYQLKSGSDKNPEYYNVNEYYKVRYGIERIYVLDYRRTMEEVLDTDTIKLKDGEVSIGVAKSDVNYLSNETGTIVGFVQAGELFEYNQNNRQIIKVFSFLDGYVNDVRAYYNQHNVKILSIDENGSMDFAVYGYMNRGQHEGYCGINLYHYDAASQKTIEEAFVATTYTYQILNASFSDLLYKTADNEFYIFVNGDLLKMNLDTLDSTKVLSKLTDGQYAAAKSGRYFAYTDSPNVADKITVLDIETDNKFDIDAKKGTKIKPLAFMDNDLVYGVVRKSDIDTTLSGTTVYPVSTLYIRDITSKNGEILKEYSEKGYYINSVNLSGFTLYLDRIQKTDDGYTTVDRDAIKNSDGEKNRAVNFLAIENKKKGEETFIKTAEVEDKTKIKKVSAKLAGVSVAKNSKTVTVDTRDSQQQYYVYVGSSVLLASTDVVKAINKADQEMGVVVDSSQHYIWKRGRKAYKTSIKNAVPSEMDKNADAISKCVSAMLSAAGSNIEVSGHVESGQSPYEILNDTLKDKIVLDLMGANLSEVLYYVSNGYPVYARTGDNTALVIVGYDSVNITVYNPASGSNTKMGMSDATKLFEDANNVFISYVDEQTEEAE